MDIDAAGNVIVAGVSSGGAFENTYDYATVLYNGSGQQQWVERYNGSSNNRDEALSVAVDGAGNIYVTGYTTSGSSTNITTIRYSTQTAIQCDEITAFTARCNSSGTVQARATLLNNTEHVGQIVSFMVDDEIHEASIFTNGTHSRAQILVPGLGQGSHVVTLVDPGGCFDPIEVGCPIPVNDQSAWQTGEGLWDEEESRPEQQQSLTDSRLLVYPNPFNPATTITFKLEQDGWVQLVIYDVVGREIAVLADGFQKSGEYRQSFDATLLSSGVYFVRLITPWLSDTQKILLTR